MAIPTEYNDNAAYVGGTNIKHPIITFKVLMNRKAEESIGPLTNLKTGAVLHPDMHDNDPDRGRTNSENHENQFSPMLPGYLRGQNIVRNDDGTITAYGQTALYLKTEYADIANPLLEVQNSEPFTSA
jgi:hypothetical protein